MVVLEKVEFFINLHPGQVENFLSLHHLSFVQVYSNLFFE